MGTKARSAMIVRSGIAWLTGLTAGRYDPAVGHHVCQGDLGEQTRMAYNKAARLLEARGYGINDVVKTVYYITPEARSNVNQAIGVRAELFGVESLPCATVITVEQLLEPGSLVELEVTANPSGKRRPLYPDPRNDWRLSYKPAWDCGNVLWFAGVVSRSYDDLGNPHFPKGFAAQTRAIFRRAGRILDLAGLGFQDVVKTTCYLRPEDLDQYEESAAVLPELFEDGLPASTTIVVNPTGALLEIDFVAVRGGERHSVDPGWPSHDGLGSPPGVRKGNLLFVGGQTGVEPITGRLLADEDPPAQARQALSNIKSVVEAAGRSMKDVVRTVHYVTPKALPRCDETKTVWREFFGDPLPPDVGVVVRRLTHPEALIEIEAVADLS